MWDYDLEDIYNLDEIGFFYRFGLNYILVIKKVSGMKKSKDRILVVFVVNVIGIIKIKLFVIIKV